MQFFRTQIDSVLYGSKLISKVKCIFMLATYVAMYVWTNFILKTKLTIVP